jgi:hypothetical protein
VRSLKPWVALGMNWAVYNWSDHNVKNWFHFEINSL